MDYCHAMEPIEPVDCLKIPMGYAYASLSLEECWPELVVPTDLLQELHLKTRPNWPNFVAKTPDRAQGHVATMGVSGMAKGKL